MKKNIRALLLLPLLAGIYSCSGGGSSSSSSSPSSSGPSSSAPASSSSSSSVTEITGYADIPIYGADMDMATYQIVPAIVDYLPCAITKEYGNEEPFASVQGAMDFLMYYGYIEHKDIEKTVSGSIISFEIKNKKPKDFTISIDSSKDTVSFSDFDAYQALGYDYYNDMGESYRAKGMEMVDNAYTSGGETTFDLSYYGLDVIQSGEEAYLPWATCSYLFLEPKYQGLAYNGEAFYWHLGPTMGPFANDGSYSPFGKAMYEGPLKGKNPSEKLSDLHGRESMFYLDHFYGFQDQYGGKKPSEWLKENHKENYDLFFSAGMEDSQKAWDELLIRSLGDGHTSTNRNLGSFYMGGAYTPSTQMSDRVSKVYQANAEVREIRKNALGLGETGALTDKFRIQIHEDMAIIRFDGFYAINSDSGRVSQDSSLEVFQAYMAYDAYSQFACAFNRIENNETKINKVVIDVSANGGGQLTACMEALCFLKDEVTLNIYDPLTGSKTANTYKGKLPLGREKSYAGEYEFYVLTSLSSFSAGNTFPGICKEEGIAKIIGQKSGGGACTVGNARTPDGQYINISSDKRMCLSSTDLDSLDKGIEPDIAIADFADYFDMDKLRSYLG